MKKTRDVVLSRRAIQILLVLVIIFHFFVIFVNISAFFILPFVYPLYVWMPLCSFILSVIFTRESCPLTKLENSLRKTLGMPKIGGFIGHYLVRPIRIKQAEKKLVEEERETLLSLLDKYPDVIQGIGG